MKSAIMCAVMSMILAVSAAGTAEPSEVLNHEMRICEVVESYEDEENADMQWVFVVDPDGDVYGMLEDFAPEIGTEIVIEFDTRGTDDKTDDVIIPEEK